MIVEVIDNVEDKPVVRGIDVASLNNEPGATPPGNGLARAGAVSCDDTSPQLSDRQFRVLNVLLTQGLGETLAQVAIRAGVSPRTIYRYMQDREFVTEYRRLCTRELSVHRAAVTKALIKGACTRGPAQPAMAKLYFERLGEPVVEHSENVNHNENNNGAVPWDTFSIGLRRAILAEVDAIAAGEDVKWWVYQLVKQVGPQPMLRPAPQEPKQVTPLDEIELDHPLCD